MGGGYVGKSEFPPLSMYIQKSDSPKKA
jgi:hypothetical protein